MSAFVLFLSHHTRWTFQESDLLVINKTDLADYVGASLEIMERDSARMRDGGATVFAQVRV